MYLASSHLRTLEQYYGSAYNDEQRITLIKEFLRAAPDAIDALVYASDAQIQALKKENDELRTRVERLEAMMSIKPKVDTKASPAPIIADFEISKESLKQAREDFFKELQKEFSR